MFLRVLLLELVLVIVVLAVWFFAPLIGIESVFWRVVIALALIIPPLAVVLARFIISRRRSDQLADAMRAQAKKQAETARPDQQEQIGELNESFSKALTALKSRAWPAAAEMRSTRCPGT
jgi:type II secretory pathway component PulL